MTKQARLDDLMAAIPHVLAAPKTDAPIDMLCWRPGFGERRFVDDLALTVDGGIPGDRGQSHPWLTLPDGSPDPRAQVSVLSKRVVDAVWLDRDNVVHPGDPIVADIDTSFENLPAGTRLRAGSAVLEVSDVPNDGCVKWKLRYGQDAKDWLVLPETLPHRLRGVLCRVVQDGVVTRADHLIKL
ncbi:hypothetical protein [Aliiroseovarius crassostreae]|uniref:hypothetical protein n=1 Tax=Aliiroseovarius crassostreae TaxID=154981 RepID=UPI003C7EC524